MKPGISALVPTFNEAVNIRACLRSVAWCDDIVVADSGSTDGTAELAASLGARVVQFGYVRGGLKKKNWALANVDFKHNWILILDADERVPEELAREIGEAVHGPSVPHAGYYLNRRTFFLGRWIRHAGYFPSWNLRLLRRGQGAYEVVPDYSGQTGDNEVHEHVLLKGTAGYLRAPLDHYAYPSIAAFVEKHNRYSTWECEVDWPRMPGDGSQGRIARHLVARRTMKHLARRFPFRDGLRFFYHYVLRLGFLDGREGYLFCRLLAEYEFLTSAKRFEKSKTGAAPIEASASSCLGGQRRIG